MAGRKRRIVVGITGASGSIYGVRLLAWLRAAGDIETHLVLSRAARQTLALETDYRPEDVEALADVVHAHGDIGAPISSGSFRVNGMVIAPCSIKTMSNIAWGNTADLISRAADVVLKERRRLVLMLRETPLHVGHLETMVKVAQIGAVVFPPVPAFYQRPQTIQDLVDQSVMRCLDLLDVACEAAPRWGVETRRQVVVARTRAARARKVA
jgi:4-hydroxy-3-polyprenylbenzoate decarboxylase